MALATKEGFEVKGTTRSAAKVKAVVSHQHRYEKRCRHGQGDRGQQHSFGHVHTVYGARTQAGARTCSRI